MNRQIFEEIPRLLLPWYMENRRDLPWRRDREPYHVWVSEIMLQQTRVEAVKGYYVRFLSELPSIEDLANCPEDRLNKLWEGLGYYSRVRNLQKAARVIMERYGGVFPRSYEEVLALPGIGPYTAGAICSICFDLRVPAVDGNVLRLVTRLTDDHRPLQDPVLKKDITIGLESVYPERAGDFTQALMELGATLCGPNGAPECDRCPCRALCLGRERGTAAVLPVKLPGKKRRVEEKTVLILCCEGRYALCRRPQNGLLAGLWQFPDLEGKAELPRVLEQVERMGVKVRDIHRQVEKKHIFTHITWEMRGIYMEVAEPGGENLFWIPEQRIDAEFALPTAYRQFWEDRYV